MAITEQSFEAVDLAYDDFEPQIAAVSPLAKLATLHAEAEVTARLANLLGRSIVAAGALTGIAGLTIAAGMPSVNASLAWIVLVMLGIGAMARSYRAAISSPFLRESLETFARELTPITLYCGFAWGAGAFLALPAETSLIGAVLFVGAPIFAVAFLLREQQEVLSFTLPLLALSSFAALLRPLPDGALAAALMLITGAVIALPLLTWERRRAASRLMPAIAELTR